MEMCREKQVLIADNDRGRQKRIVDRVYAAAAEVNMKVKVYIAFSAERAFHILEKKDIDLLVLNTVYGNEKSRKVSGVRLVERIRKVEKYASLPVVFVSSSAQWKRYSFTELNCIGYQPLSFDNVKLEKILKKGLHHTTTRDREKSLLLKTKKLLYPICVKDIAYVEAESRMLHFGLRDGSVIEVPYRTLMDVKEKINSRSLIQCARNIIINTDYVVDTEGKEVFLSVGDKIKRVDIGIKFRKNVKMALL